MNLVSLACEDAFIIVVTLIQPNYIQNNYNAKTLNQSSAGVKSCLFINYSFGYCFVCLIWFFTSRQQSFS